MLELSLLSSLRLLLKSTSHLLLPLEQGFPGLFQGMTSSMEIDSFVILTELMKYSSLIVIIDPQVESILANSMLNSCESSLDLLACRNSILSSISSKW